MQYVLMIVALIAGVHGRRVSPHRLRQFYGAHETPQQPDDDDDDYDSVPEGDRDCSRDCPKNKYPWIPVCGYWPKHGKFYTFLSKCHLDSWNDCFLTNFSIIGEFECNTVAVEYRYRFWEYDMQGNMLSDEDLRKFQEKLSPDNKNRYYKRKEKSRKID